MPWHVCSQVRAYNIYTYTYVRTNLQTYGRVLHVVHVI